MTRARLTALLVIGAGAFAVVAGGCGGGAKQLAFRGSAVDNPSPSPDFSLRDQQGRTVRLSAQRGRVVVIAFLYTRCPDVCPIIAANLNQALRTLGPQARDVRVLAVSVDPKGDTPRAVRRYVREHRLLPQFRYLIGSRRQLARVWKAYGVAINPNKLDLVDHTAYELLVDPKGIGRVIYDSHVRTSAVVHDIRALQG
jgi:protein SCO1/2